MRFMEDGVWGQWQPYNQTCSYILESPDDGAKEIYLQLKDRAGNLSPTTSSSAIHDSIILDTDIPYSIINPIQENKTIELSVVDTRGSPYLLFYRIDNGSWTDYGGPFSLEGTGTRVIDYYSEDLAGNRETQKQLTLHFPESPPEIAVYIIVGSIVGSTIIALLALSFFLKRRNSRKSMETHQQAQTSPHQRQLE